MLALKVAKLMRIKQKWDEQRELEAEIDKMVSQLVQTASPEIAMQVEKMMLMSPRATRLITGEDGEGFRARAARRGSTATISVRFSDSAATANLVSVSPGVTP